jgi:hypothetical protein
MALKDDINVPLCVSVGLLVAVIVAIAVVSTEAGYNYVDNRIVSARYVDIEQNRPELIYSHNIVKDAKAELEKTGPRFENGVQVGQRLKIEDAIKLVAQNKGAAPK